jgi:hypothetical protein
MATFTINSFTGFCAMVTAKAVFVGGRAVACGVGAGFVGFVGHEFSPRFSRRCMHRPYSYQRFSRQMNALVVQLPKNVECVGPKSYRRFSRQMNALVVQLPSECPHAWFIPSVAGTSLHELRRGCHGFENSIQIGRWQGEAKIETLHRREVIILR